MTPGRSSGQLPFCIRPNDQWYDFLRFPMGRILRDATLGHRRFFACSLEESSMLNCKVEMLRKKSRAQEVFFGSYGHEYMRMMMDCPRIAETFKSVHEYQQDHRSGATLDFEIYQCVDHVVSNSGVKQILQQSKVIVPLNTYLPY